MGVFASMFVARGFMIYSGVGSTGLAKMGRVPDNSNLKDCPADKYNWLQLFIMLFGI